MGRLIGLPTTVWEHAGGGDPAARFRLAGGRTRTPFVNSFTL